MLSQNPTQTIRYVCMYLYIYIMILCIVCRVFLYGDVTQVTGRSKDYYDIQKHSATGFMLARNCWHCYFLCNKQVMFYSRQMFDHQRVMVLDEQTHRKFLSVVCVLSPSRVHEADLAIGNMHQRDVVNLFHAERRSNYIKY